jgi:hypothetical protein
MKKRPKNVKKAEKKRKKAWKKVFLKKKNSGGVTHIPSKN